MKNNRYMTKDKRIMNNVFKSEYLGIRWVQYNRACKVSHYYWMYDYEN